MPRFPRRARRTYVALVALVALGVWCAYAWAATTVTVVMPDEETEALDLSQRQPVLGTSYRVRDTRGGDFRLKPIAQPYPLNDIFREMGAFDGIAEVELGGGVIRLTKAQLDDVPPPALYIENDEVRFIRNSFGPNDVNGPEEDLVVTEIVQASESSLRVEASATKDAKAGDAVKFEVTTSGGGAGRTYSFEWDFGDGSEGKGASPTHEFAEAGTYNVVVTAVPNRGDVETDGGTDRVKVRVGEPKATTDDTGAGGTNDATGAPLSGTYDGSSGAGTSGGTVTPSTPYTPASPPAPPPPPGDSLDSLKTDTAPAGDTVEGALLANVSATPNDVAAAQRAAEAGEVKFEEPAEDEEVPAAAWAGLGALALMGAGAGLESGRRPRLRRPGLRARLPRR